MLFVLGPPATLVIFLALIFSTDLGTARTLEQLVSWPYALQGVIAGATAVGCCLGGVAPRLAAMCAALGPFCSLGGEAGVREAIIAAVWGSVLIVDAVLRRHQVSTAEGTTVGLPSGGAPGPVGTVVGIGPVRAAIAVFSIVLALGAAWTWSERRGDFVALQSRVEIGSGTVAAPVDGVARVTVDGETYDFWDTAFNGLEPGSLVDVMVDPSGVERPFGPGDADPDGWSDWVTLIGAGLVGIVVTLVARRRAKRSVDHLLAGDSVGVRARVDVDENVGRLRLLPLDADRPVCLLNGVELVRSDRRRFGWVDRMDADDVLRTRSPEWVPATRSRDADARQVVVHGLRRFGDPVVLVIESPAGPIVVAAMGGVSDSRSVRGVAGTVLDRFSRGSAGRPTRRSSGGSDDALAGPGPDGAVAEPAPAMRWLSDRGAVLRWLLIPVGALGAWFGHWLWTSGEDDFGSWLLLLVSASMIFTVVDLFWAVTGRRIRVDGDRLLIRGQGARDLVVDLAAVREIRTRPEYLALDLHDRDDDDEAIVVRPAFPGTGHGRAELESMRVDIQTAIDGLEVDSAEREALGRRLGSSTIAAVLTAMPYSIAAIVASRGQMPLFDWSLFA